MKKPYNTTDLRPDKTFTKHVFHRDQFAHYFRWTYILKEAKIGEVICDFGCGNGNLLEVLYRNRFKQAKYIGIDIRDIVSEELKNIPWAHFIQDDLIKPKTVLSEINADKVCSFEVLEHVGKQNGELFMNNFSLCGKQDATYYLSTPNYDEKVGAAGNHTYDSGDGIKVQEYTHQELEQLFEKTGFKVIKKFGTFASIKDYKDLLTGWKLEMFNSLREYYDSNILSNIMAPFFPDQSRNTLWVLNFTRSEESKHV